MEIWVGSTGAHADHGGTGPWSNHRQDTSCRLRIAIDGDAFTLSYSHRDEHVASNRGDLDLDEVEVAGHVVVEPDGARLLHVTRRIAERHEHHEPMEDMWTPPIDHVETFGPAELAAGDRYAVRIPPDSGSTGVRLVEVTRVRFAAGHYHARDRLFEISLRREP